MCSYRRMRGLVSEEFLFRPPVGWAKLWVIAFIPTLSCISKHFYDHFHHIKPSMVINTNAGPAIIVTSASDDELINLGWCRLRIKLGKKTFKYYFQILINLKQDLILYIQGLNIQRTFKISQDITDDNDLYLHIRRKIVTFSQQAKNTTNHIKNS